MKRASKRVLNRVQWHVLDGYNVCSCFWFLVI